MRKKHPLLDGHEIAPNLWQGSVPPNGDRLRQAGFDVLVLCAREHQYPTTSYQGVQVIHAPNDDNPAYGPLTREKLAVALRAAHTVAAAMGEGKCCLVTCAAGMNRSGLVSALSLHLSKGWSGDKCIREVRQKRGRHPKGFKPLSNSEFTTALRQLKARAVGGQSPAASG